MPYLVDVVVVTHNSSKTILDCVRSLIDCPEARVIVVDNASHDGSVDLLQGTSAVTIALERNVGFARASNIGWRSSDAPFVLFLNPDARIDWVSVASLLSVLHDDQQAAVVGPRVERPDGRLELTQHRFPRLRSMYGQALFLHRLGVDVTDDVTDPGLYRVAQAPDWLTGACLLVRRSVLARLDGFDEHFFLYEEDADLCRRVRDRGLSVRYQPAAVARHLGGGSSRPEFTLPLYATSRILYARKHHGQARAAAERFALVLRALTHLVLARGGWRVRLGHVRSLRSLLGKP